MSEWKSREAIDAAHKNPKVLAMWEKFFAVCDCVPLNTLSEAADMFAGFTPIGRLMPFGPPDHTGSLTPEQRRN